MGQPSHIHLSSPNPSIKFWQSLTHSAEWFYGHYAGLVGAWPSWGSRVLCPRPRSLNRVPRQLIFGRIGPKQKDGGLQRLNSHAIDFLVIGPSFDARNAGGQQLLIFCLLSAGDLVAHDLWQCNAL